MADKRSLDPAAWGMLAACFLTWLVVLSRSGGWVLAAMTAAAGVGAHAYAMLRRGHAGLSADPVVLPAALVAHVAGILLLAQLGVQPVARKSWLELVVALPVAWLLGHLAAFAWMALADKLFPKRTP